MTFTETMKILSYLLSASGLLILAWVAINYLKQIKENTEKINMNLEYIVNHIENNAANETINKIEEELESIK